MATIPTGNPPWLRTAGILTYGGHTEKRNFMSQGAVDPRTDMSAEQLCAIARDLAAVVRTAAFAKLKVQCHDTTPDDPTVLWCHMQNGVTEESYEGDAPPTGFPTVTRVSDGVFRVTFDQDPTDDFGVSGKVDIKAAKGDPDNLLAVVSWNEDDPDTDGYNERVTFTVSNGSPVQDSVTFVEIYT